MHAPTTDPPALAALADEYWQDFLAAHPVFATVVGDNRFDDQLDDISAEGLWAGSASIVIGNEEDADKVFGIAAPGSHVDRGDVSPGPTTALLRAWCGAEAVGLHDERAGC